MRPVGREVVFVGIFSPEFLGGLIILDKVCFALVHHILISGIGIPMTFDIIFRAVGHPHVFQLSIHNFRQKTRVKLSLTISSVFLNRARPIF